jgi:hypothetical protein
MPMYSARTESNRNRRPNIKSMRDVIVPKPGDGTPSINVLIIPITRAINEMPERIKPAMGINFKGLRELANIPRIAKAPVTNGLNEDVPPVRAGRSYSILVD